MTEIITKIEQILDSKAPVLNKKNKILGRKGLLNEAFKQLKTLTAKEKADFGGRLNKLRLQAEQLTAIQSESQTEFIDLSLPALPNKVGCTHPINQTMDRMVNIFKGLGFEVYTGPEIVSDYNNFGSLNFADDHPARDTQDSFSLKSIELMLRTQTSATQVPIMKNHSIPMRVIVPGKVYRREADATHMPMFHQLEGFVIDSQVRYSDLKGLLTHFVTSFFGKEVKMRFRPHFFPFTEPSAEVDIWWERENGQGRWLEILGCGMIHPVVLENAGINSKKYQGIAFGLGLERPFMLRHKLDDMRQLFNNDEDFLKSFNSK